MDIKIENLQKKYGDHVIFDNFSIQINSGDFIGIIGESGSGKSTLLNIIGLIDSFDNGSLYYNNINITNYSNRKAMLLRRNSISYIFQNYGLIQDKTIEYNMDISMKYHKQKNKTEFLKNYFDQVNLSTKLLSKKANELSGGEQQRISICKSLIKNPKVILADEPTGSLDEKNKIIILDLLAEINKSGKTIIMVSHETSIHSYFSKILNLT